MHIIRIIEANQTNPLKQIYRQTVTQKKRQTGDARTYIGDKSKKERNNLLYSKTTQNSK